jgi:membrane protein DedA with SNARE-associated domain
VELSPYLIELVQTYGYLAVFLGSLIEGDALVLVASFLAYLGKLDLLWVMVAAFFGTWLSDIIWFMLGRYGTQAFFARWEWLNNLSQTSIAIVVFIWVLVFSALGYFFASVAESVFGRMKHLEIILPLIIVSTLLCFIYASHIFEYALKMYPKREPK